MLYFQTLNRFFFLLNATRVTFTTEMADVCGQHGVALWKLVYGIVSVLGFHFHSIFFPDIISSCEKHKREKKAITPKLVIGQGIGGT